MTIRNRLTNIKFTVITVYGPAHHDTSKAFLQELDGICGKEPLALVLEGDFNLIRESLDKSSDNCNTRLMDMFNEFIGRNQLRELDRTGPQYTWSSNQDTPILAKLDRILISTNWESHFLHCVAWSITRVGSDHSPIILDLGEQGAPRPKYFYFEDQWLSQPDFKDMVVGKWKENMERRPTEFYSLDGWHGSLCLVIQHLKGWGIQLTGQQKKSKTDLYQELQKRDREADNRDLSIEEWHHRYNLEGKLEKIYHLEEIYWHRRVGDQWTVKGDSNTEFFLQYANERRKSTIVSLKSDQGVIRGQDAITDHIVGFYKNLFGPNPPRHMRLASGFWFGHKKLTESSKEALLRPFIETEIKEAIF